MPGPAQPHPAPSGEALADAAATARAWRHRRLDHHVRRAWKSFKMGAVSCFSFVGPVGLAYLPKLVTDGARPHPTGAATRDRGPPAEAWPPVDLAGQPRHARRGIAPADRVDLAEGALRGMSLVEGFAPIVLLAGHGSTTVNNPYGTGLDCGACGGHTGEVNARVAAAHPQRPRVRAGLARPRHRHPRRHVVRRRAHDTTTDDVVALRPRPRSRPPHRAELAELAGRLAEAGRRARAERAARLGLARRQPTSTAPSRLAATDWAQVRPEWGLAGCRAFVAAPRRATRGLDLGGRAFLHSYDWQADEGFGSSRRS